MGARLKTAVSLLVLGLAFRQNSAAFEGGGGPGGYTPGQYQPQHAFKGASKGDQENIFRTIRNIEDSLESARHIVQILSDLDSSAEFRERLVQMAITALSTEMPTRVGKQSVEGIIKGDHPHPYQASETQAVEITEQILKILTSLSEQFPADEEKRKNLEEFLAFVNATHTEYKKRLGFQIPFEAIL